MRLKVILFFSFIPSLFSSSSLPERVGHTTLTPRHSDPDDKGMYAAAIDPAAGYAYFAGNYLFKLDITTPLPTQVGPALFVGQFAGAAIDVSASFVFFPGSSVFRYSLGTGPDPVTPAGSLTPSAGRASALVLDDSDPNPANHYLYAICSGTAQTPATVVKISVSTFTEVSSVSLAPLEYQFLLAPLGDPSHGYAYFVSLPSAVSPISQVVKIKMTQGNAPPVRIGAVPIDSVGTGIDGGSIDTLHGYAYYGTYDSDPSVPGRLYKIKLEDGDVPPSTVGHISLHPGEGRLAASVIDPENGYVYFADDNTYPGGVYQLLLNGDLLPLEVSYTPFLGGPAAPPPNGMTASNTTTDPSGILPYGEVFFRSAVFDPVRHFAYFGQDSRPNQIVKVQLPTTPSTPTPTPTPTPTSTPTPTPTPPPLVNISGTISYCSNPVPGPVAGATLILTGTAEGSTLSDASGNYQFLSLSSGGSYTVTPTKTALASGSAGITTVDVLAVQRHFLNITPIPAGCRLTAADVNGDANITTVDVIAIQRFYLGLTTGIANVGKFQFSPVSRSYPGIVSDQTSQNYDTLIFGDVASPFVE